MYGVARAVLNSTNALLLAMNKQEIVALIMFVSLINAGNYYYSFGFSIRSYGAAHLWNFWSSCAIPFSLYFVRKVLYLSEVSTVILTRNEEKNIYESGRKCRLLRDEDDNNR